MVELSQAGMRGSEVEADPAKAVHAIIATLYEREAELTALRVSLAALEQEMDRITLIDPTLPMNEQANQLRWLIDDWRTRLAAIRLGSAP